MITMNELVDLRMQQQIAQEILYRQQIMQRLPDPFAAAMMPSMHMLTPHMLMPAHAPLPGVDAKLENEELWQQFHKIGTEMIITKCGRRMFPSMRVSLKGLEEESQYCVLVEMVPIGDCRYKFSGSQWVPAGGAEPQSPQRMYLHPDSPASGAHWQAQPILFNKVKLTNNTLDNNGHVVLASMHKYQPRIHVIRTNDLSQIPWAPQQAFVFPETEFVAVTAYQNDRITKLKIDNNPFAKGFRETGQSKCKRKMSLSPDLCDDQQHNNSTHTDDDQSSVASSQDSPQAKRFCNREESSSYPSYMDVNGAAMRYALQQHQHQLAVDQHHHDFATIGFYPQLNQIPVTTMYMPHAGPRFMDHRFPFNFPTHLNNDENDFISNTEKIICHGEDEQVPELFVDVVNNLTEESSDTPPKAVHKETSLDSSLSSSSSSPSPASPASLSPSYKKSQTESLLSCDLPAKRTSFSISSILGSNTRNIVSV